MDDTAHDPETPQSSAPRTGEVQPAGDSIRELVDRMAANLEPKFQAQEALVAAGGLLPEDPEIAREQERLARQAWNRLADRRIPARAARVILGGVPGGKDREEIPPLDERTPAMRIVRTFMAGAPGTMCISGGVGCGKSVAAAWAVSLRTEDPYVGNHPDGWNGSWPADYHPRFVDAARLARLPRFSGRGEQAAALAPFETCSTLAIDDLGMEQDQAFAGILDSLIVTRHDNRLRTIITTNMPLTVFEQTYGARVMDRIREGGFFALNAPSRRGVNPR